MQEKVALLEGRRTAVVGTDPPDSGRGAAGPDSVAAPRRGASPSRRRRARRGGAPASRGGAAVTLPVVGFHQIEDASWARVGGEAGADPARAVAALGGVRLPPAGRAALARGLTVIDDTLQRQPRLAALGAEAPHWLADRRRRPSPGRGLDVGARAGECQIACGRPVENRGPAAGTGGGGGRLRAGRSSRTGPALGDR